ncbi:MAG TPA: nuclear transport factor 2 family protein [Hyphomicrobiaceae bacterium]|nr:nuclear transport factor 2 family protein [Hyphomicrobiaceae bacterium]
MTAPTSEARDALFKTFGRAWFKRDVDLLYEAVTPDFQWRGLDSSGAVRLISTRDGVAEAFRSMATSPLKVRFEDVAYHHAPDASFMTFRIIETDPATGKSREDVGVERYTFRDGRIAVKDVYRKPVRGD